MKFNINYLIILSLGYIISTGCTKEECRVRGGNYEFVLPLTLSPQKDTFSIGDTITINSNFPNLIHERITIMDHVLDNFLFFPQSRMRRIDTIGAIDNFSEFEVIVSDDFYNEFSIFSSGAKALRLEYNYIDQEYVLNFKLIPKKKGLFYFTFSSLVDQLGSDQDFAGKCPKVEIGAVLNLNDGNDNNISFMNDSPDPHYNDWILLKPDDRFHKFGGYCFYVK